MPVYNRSEMVAQMIDSIIANDFTQWELIAVDDGSDEETLSMLGDYCEKDERISVVRRNETPKGPLTCRNIGFRQAVGEYVVFFDSDDYVTPACLRNRVECMDAHPELDFMVFPAGEFADGRIDTESVVYSYGYRIHTDDIAAFASRILPFVVWSNIYRRDSLTDNGIKWDTGLQSLEDTDFNIQSILAGLKYDYVLTAPDYGYRIRENSSSLSKQMSKHYDSHIHALDKTYCMIRTSYGNRYDRELFEGLMTVFTMVGRDGYNPDFIGQLRLLLHKYDVSRERVFLRMMKRIRILSRLLPEQRSRQLATFRYLLQYVWRLKVLKPYRIKKMVHNHSNNI